MQQLERTHRFCVALTFPLSLRGRRRGLPDTALAPIVAQRVHTGAFQQHSLMKFEASAGCTVCGSPFAAQDVAASPEHHWLTPSTSMPSASGNTSVSFSLSLSMIGAEPGQGSALEVLVPKERVARPPQHGCTADLAAEFIPSSTSSKVSMTSTAGRSFEGPPGSPSWR